MMGLQAFPLPVRVAVPASHWDGSLAVDLMAPEGTPVLAVFDGVAQARDYSLGGHTVTLTAPDGTVAYYAHLRDPGVSGSVRAGDVIGFVGTTGNARGGPPHLHFAIGTRIDEQGSGDIAPWEWLAGASPPRPAHFADGGLSPLGILLLAAGVVALLELLE